MPRKADSTDASSKKKSTPRDIQPEHITAFERSGLSLDEFANRLNQIKSYKGSAARSDRSMQDRRASAQNASDHHRQLFGTALDVELGLQSGQWVEIDPRLERAKANLRRFSSASVVEHVLFPHARPHPHPHPHRHSASTSALAPPSSSTVSPHSVERTPTPAHLHVQQHTQQHVQQHVQQHAHQHVQQWPPCNPSPQPFIGRSWSEPEIHLHLPTTATAGTAAPTTAMRPHSLYPHDSMPTAPHHHQQQNVFMGAYTSHAPVQHETANYVTYSTHPPIMDHHMPRHALPVVSRHCNPAHPTPSPADSVELVFSPAATHPGSHESTPSPATMAMSRGNSHQSLCQLGVNCGGNPMAAAPSPHHMMDVSSRPEPRYAPVPCGFQEFAMQGVEENAHAWESQDVMDGGAGEYQPWGLEGTPAPSSWDPAAVQWVLENWSPEWGSHD